MRKIAGVVVTYNRPDILEKCLKSMLEQSVLPDRIFVIDNSPNNNTREMMGKRFPQIKYEHHPDNIGSEGGYYEGVKLACAESDYIWLLDDDCISERGALAELVRWIDELQKKEKVGAVRSARAWDKSDGPPVKEIEDLFAWRGTLISSEAVRTIGLPEREFFLYAGDIEYGLRMKKTGYKIYLVFSSKIESLDFTNKQKKRVGKVRAEFYTQPFRIYYSYRNELMVYIKHKKFLKALKLMLYGFKNICFCIFSGQLKEAFATLEGIIDGARKRTGKNYKYLP